MAKSVKRTAGAVPRPFTVEHVPTSPARWAVTQGERRRLCDALCIQVTLVNHGAILAGVGVVTTIKRGEIVITA